MGAAQDSAANEKTTPGGGERCRAGWKQRQASPEVASHCFMRLNHTHTHTPEWVTRALRRGAASLQKGQDGEEEAKAACGQSALKGSWAAGRGLELSTLRHIAGCSPTHPWLGIYSDSSSLSAARVLKGCSAPLRHQVAVLTPKTWIREKEGNPAETWGASQLSWPRPSALSGTRFGPGPACPPARQSKHTRSPDLCERGRGHCPPRKTHHPAHSGAPASQPLPWAPNGLGQPCPQQPHSRERLAQRHSAARGRLSLATKARPGHDGACRSGKQSGNPAKPLDGPARRTRRGRAAPGANLCARPCKTWADPPALLGSRLGPERASHSSHKRVEC